MMTSMDEEEERLPMLRKGAGWGAANGCGGGGGGGGDDDDDDSEDLDDREEGGSGKLMPYTDHQGERWSSTVTTSRPGPSPPPSQTRQLPNPAASLPINHKPPAASTASPTRHLPGHDHDLDVQDDLRKFKLRAVECVANAYERSNGVSRTRGNGSLGTSLPEDVVFLFETQLAVLQEYLQKKQPNSTTTAASTTVNVAQLPSPPSLWDTPKGQDWYHDAVLSIVECLIHTQKCVRPVFLTTLEACCESANDFLRLSDKMEQLLGQWQAAGTPQQQQEQQLLASKVAAAWNGYVALLSQDAVGAAERTHVFVVRDFGAWHQRPYHPPHQHHPPNPMRRLGPNHRHHHPHPRARPGPPPAALFSYQWEVECTSNEIVTGLLEDVCEAQHWSKIQRYLDHEILRNKAIVALCRAFVCYYVRCLVERADAAVRKLRQPHQSLVRLRGVGGGGLGRSPIGGGRRPGAHPHGGFLHAGRALRRMKDDIAIIKQYFVSKAAGNPTLTRIVSNELYILELIHECLDAAAASDGDEADDDDNNNNNNSDDDLFLDSFIVVIHKRTGGDALVTRHFVGDLFLLVNHQERPLQLTVLQQDLHLVTKRMEEVRAVGGANHHPHQDKTKKAELSLVSVDQMLRAMYEDRIVQGMLPLCWTCLPKVEPDDAGGMELVSAKIREMTRGVADLRMKRKASPLAGKLGRVSP